MSSCPSITNFSKYNETRFTSFTIPQNIHHLVKPHTSSNHLPHPPRLHLINPSTNLHTPRHQLTLPQKFHILPNRLLEIRKRQEIKTLRLQLPRRPLAQILIDDRIDVFVLERQHSTPGVLDQEDRGRAEELLRDYDGA